MKKRLVSGLLIGCMLLSLVGCKKDGKGGENATTSATATGTYATYDYFSKLTGRDKNPADSVEYKYADFVTLGEYKGVKAEFDLSIKNVTDKDIEEMYTSILEDYGKTEQIKEGKVADGDTINLDFEGLLDGKAFDNGTATNYTYTIGGGFIKDLNDGLIGLEVGKETSIPCKFPDDYSEESLAGKDVVFVVTVNYISKLNLPEVNDELIAKIVKDYNLKDEYKSVDGIKKYVKEYLEESAKANFEETKLYAAWDVIIDNAKFNGMPQIDYDAQKASVKANFEATVTQYASYGIDRATILSMYGFKTEEELNKYFDDYAKEYVETKLLVIAIADKENISVTKEEYDALLSDYATYYEYKSVDEFVAALEKQGEDMAVFKEALYYEIVVNKVSDLILENCVEVDKPVETDKEESTDKGDSTEKTEPTSKAE